MFCIAVAGVADRAVRIDEIEAVEAAGPESQGTDVAPGIEADQAALDIGGARKIVNVGVRLRVAESHSDGPIVGHADVDAADDAAKVRGHAGGIAVAVDVAPRADALRPERRVGGENRRGRRRPGRGGVAEGQIGTGRGGGRLAQATEQSLADEQALIDQDGLLRSRRFRPECISSAWGRSSSDKREQGGIHVVRDVLAVIEGMVDGARRRRAGCG